MSEKKQTATGRATKYLDRIEQKYGTQFLLLFQC